VSDDGAGTVQRAGDSAERQPVIGVLCALPAELGTLAEHAVDRRRRSGLEILELDLGGELALACVAGVGKVAAARAAALLLAEGTAKGLLVVGTCGSLGRGQGVGTLVHCHTAFQVDLSVREGRSVETDATWRGAWRAAVEGPEAWFLTADRPVTGLWRRRSLSRAFPGPAVVDMETTAVGAVACAAGLPWAALRVVTDRAGPRTPQSFARNYPTLAGLPADTLVQLVPILGG